MNCGTVTNMLAMWVICAGLVGELVAGAVASARGVEAQSEPGFWTGVLAVAGGVWVLGVAERALPDWARTSRSRVYT